MRHIVIALLTITLIASGCAGLVLAQDATSSPSPTSTRRQKAQQRVQEIRENYASRAAQRRGEIAEKLAEHRQRMASRAAELRERLALFKDKKKAATAERINSVFSLINEKRTEAMRRHLERMSELLDKLQERVDKKITEGKDGATANNAIASASAAIASASTAVDAQALKGYTIKVSSESAVRADAKVTRDALHTDLQGVRKLVIDAKQAVANAIRTAATSLGGIGEGSE